MHRKRSTRKTLRSQGEELKRYVICQHKLLINNKYVNKLILVNDKEVGSKKNKKIYDQTGGIWKAEIRKSMNAHQ